MRLLVLLTACLRVAEMVQAQNSMQVSLADGGPGSRAASCLSGEEQEAGWEAQSETPPSAPIGGEDMPTGGSVRCASLSSPCTSFDLCCFPRMCRGQDFPGAHMDSRDQLED